LDIDKIVKDALMPKIRSISLNLKEDTMLIGTFGSEIYELQTESKDTFNDDGISKETTWMAKCLMKGHYTPNPLWTNEVWGLDILHKDKTKYVTCSDDATLRLYSITKRKLLKLMRLDVDKKGKRLKWVKAKGQKGKGMP